MIVEFENNNFSEFTPPWETDDDLSRLISEKTMDALASEDYSMLIPDILSVEEHVRRVCNEIYEIGGEVANLNRKVYEAKQAIKEAEANFWRAMIEGAKLNKVKKPSDTIIKALVPGDKKVVKANQELASVTEALERAKALQSALQYKAALLPGLQGAANFLRKSS